MKPMSFDSMGFRLSRNSMRHHDEGPFPRGCPRGLAHQYGLTVESIGFSQTRVEFPVCLPRLGHASGRLQIGIILRYYQVGRLALRAERYRTIKDRKTVVAVLQLSLPLVLGRTYHSKCEASTHPKSRPRLLCGAKIRYLGISPGATSDRLRLTLPPCCDFSTSQAVVAHLTLVEDWFD